MNEAAIPPNLHFLGRGRELIDLTEAFDPERVVVVTGRAGVGKTTLCAAFANRVRKQGQKVCWISCPEGGEFAALTFELNRWLLERKEERFAHVLANEKLGFSARIAAVLSALNRQQALLA